MDKYCAKCHTFLSKEDEACYKCGAHEFVGIGTAVERESQFDKDTAMEMYNQKRYAEAAGICIDGGLVDRDSNFLMARMLIEGRFDDEMRESLARGIARGKQTGTFYPPDHEVFCKISQYPMIERAIRHVIVARQKGLDKHELLKLKLKYSLNMKSLVHPVFVIKAWICDGLGCSVVAWRALIAFFFIVFIPGFMIWCNFHYGVSWRGLIETVGYMFALIGVYAGFIGFMKYAFFEGDLKEMEETSKGIME